MKWWRIDKIKRRHLKWYRWFAWYPVCVCKLENGDKKYVWLKTVERKDDHFHGWIREIGSEKEYYYSWDQGQ